MRRFQKCQRQFLVPGIVVSLLVLFSPFARSQGQIAAVRDASGAVVFVNANVQGNAGTSPLGKVWRRNGDRAASAQSEQIRQAVRQESQRARVDPKLVRAIIKAESDGDPRAVSPKGAQGLMQLIPATARRFGVDNPFDPGQNIHGGIRYLRYLLNLFGGNVPLTLAAYDAGEHRVLRSGGVPPIVETQNYVKKVSALYRASNPTTGAGASPRQISAPAVYRFVDSNGVIHFATGDDDLPPNAQLAENDPQ